MPTEEEYNFLVNDLSPAPGVGQSDYEFLTGSAPSRGLDESPLIEQAQARSLETGAPVGQEGFIGGLKEAGRGVIRGLTYTGPEMIGKAAQFIDQPGGSDTIRNLGITLEDRSKRFIDEHPGLQQSSLATIKKEEDALSVRGSAGEAAEMGSLSLGPAIAGATAGSVFGPVGTAVGGIAGFATSVLGMSLATGEETQREGVEKGISPEKAREAGWINAGLEAGGEAAVAVMTGGMARILPRTVRKDLVNVITSRFQKPADMFKGAAKLLTTEVGTEVGQGYGQELTKEKYGFGTEAKLSDQVAVIMPTLMMSAFTFGAADTFGGYKRAKLEKTLSGDNVSQEERQKAVDTVYSQAASQDKETADLWKQYAQPLVDQNKPVIASDFDAEEVAKYIGPGRAEFEAQKAKAGALSDDEFIQKMQSIQDEMIPKEAEQIPDLRTEAEKAGAVFVNPEGVASSDINAPGQRDTELGLDETKNAIHARSDKEMEDILLQLPSLPKETLIVMPDGSTATARDLEIAQKERATREKDLGLDEVKNLVPEQPETIAAQLKAFEDGRKPAVLITEGEKIPDLPEGAKTAEIEGRGTLIYKDDADLKLAQNNQMGIALGLGIDEKPQTDTVVTARDAQGTVVADTATDGRPEVMEAAERLAGKGGTVETRTVADALEERSIKLPKNYNNPKLKRIQYRGALESLANDIDKENKPILTGGSFGMDPRQEKNTSIDRMPDVRREPSLNPDWYKRLASDFESEKRPITTQYVKDSVEKALSGKTLGKKQAEIVDSLLSVIEDERSGNVGFVKNETVDARQVRKGFSPIAAQDESEIRAVDSDYFEKEAYDPDWDEETHAVADLARIAESIDVDAAERILDSNKSDSIVAQELLEFINERKQQEGIETTTSRSEERLQAETDQGGKRSDEEEFSLTNQTDEELQAIEDKKVASEEKEKAEIKKEEQEQTVDDFLLTGSNSSADQAMARGQKDLLAGSNEIKKPVKNKAIAEAKPETAPEKKITGFTQSESDQIRERAKENNLEDFDRWGRGRFFDRNPDKSKLDQFREISAQVWNEENQKESDNPVAGKKKSETPDISNIPVGRVQAKKQSPGKFKLFYIGTENEVFPGEIFKTAPESKRYFKEQQAKQKEPAKEERPAIKAEKTAAKSSGVFKEKKSSYGAKNKLVTQDRADELREILRAKLGQVSSGIDPATLSAGTELAVFHIEAGVRKFGELAKAMAEDLGTTIEKLRPYLRSWYNGARDMMEDGGIDVSDMDTADQVRDQLKTVGAKQAEKGSLLDVLINKLPDINDNRQLKNVISEYNNVTSSEVTDEMMKEGQETLELAIVRQARNTVESGGNSKSIFAKLVDQYNSQPNLDIRSSTSIQNQAYSTPAPLAYLASNLAHVTDKSTVYEPTAGNGMLLIGSDPVNVIANELNDLRASQLGSQGFQVTKKDATKFTPETKVDAVIANPPFGKIKDGPVKVDGYTIKSIDHMIAAKSLESLKNDGRATIIIGASKKEGDISPSDRTFFNWLYSKYNVVDQFEVDGDLYKRQGAAWPVRVLVINGRAESNNISPVTGSIERVRTWDEVYERYTESLDASQRQPDRSGAASINVEDQQNAKIEPTESRNVGEGQAPGSDARSGRGRAGRGLNAGTGARSGGTSVIQPDVRGQSERDGRVGQPDMVNGAGGSKQTGVVVNAGKTDTGQLPGRHESRNGKPGVKGSAFQAKYVTRSKGSNEDVLMPVNMADALGRAMDNLVSEVGDLDNYVMDKLGYDNKAEFFDAFMGLQVDSIAAVIHNMEKGKGAIIADQTGVGKGRQAAGILRYAMQQGKIPVFVTAKDNLFTDMYNDLADIKTESARPFILNQDGFIKSGKDKIFTNPKNAKRKKPHQDNILDIIANKKLPDNRNMLFLTYSQINKENNQRRLIDAIKENAIFVLDESHNAAGQRESIGKGGKKVSTAGFIYKAIENSPVAYLSATWAKRPDNMPVYYRTDLMDAVDNIDDLVDAVAAGGAPLQTIMSNMLAESGQLFRRERSFDGISIKTVIDTDNTAQHTEFADKVTEGLRAITKADGLFHSLFVEKYAKDIQLSGGDAFGAGNKASASVDHTNFTSIVHNFISQLLVGLKVDRAADMAIESHKAGEKPVLALENTMGSFLKKYVDAAGLEVGDPIEATYKDILKFALDRSRRISIKSAKGDKASIDIPVSDLDPITKAAYIDAEKVIDSLEVEDLPVSPIDYIRNKLAENGIRSAEITGRSYMVDYSQSPPVLALRNSQEINDRNGTVNAFNTGKLDALILNAAGSTGLSIHASKRKDFTDKKKRHMIVIQAMADINTLMQMLGRINRTGQVVLPEYTMMGVDLPIEKRPLAKTAGKLKSLNANTSANTDSDTSIKSFDLMNKYGDRIVNDFLKENAEISTLLNIPTESSNNVTPGLATKFTGRLALLPVKQQSSIYTEIESAYKDLIDYLNKTNQNDLEPSTLDLDARILESKVAYEGKAPETLFGGHTILHKVDAKYQGHPPTPRDVEEVLSKKLPDADSISDSIIKKKSDDQSYLHILNDRKAVAEKSQSELKSDATEEDKKTAASALAKTEKDLGDYRLSEEAFNRMAKTFRIGSHVRLDLGDELVTGVVINIRDSHKKGAGNPYSLSKTRVTFMVNSGIRQIDLPFSQLTFDRNIFIEKLQNTGTQGLDATFAQDMAEGERREIRYIATDNIIAGSAKFPNGRITSFTDNKGQVRQGILMPKKYGKEGEFESEGTSQNFSMRDSKVLVKFLKNNRSLLRPGVGSVDNQIRITPADNGQWTITIPRSNKDSSVRSVKFDEDLQKAMGTEFFGKTKYMTATFKESRLGKVIPILNSLVLMHGLPSYRSAWEASGGNKAPEAVKSFDKETTKFSKGKTTGTTKDEAESLITRKYKGVKRLLDNDELEVVQSVEDLPKGLKVKAEDNIQGLFDGKKTYIVADAVNKSNIDSVLLHEMTHRMNELNHDLKESLIGKKGEFTEIFNKIKDGTYKGPYQKFYQEAIDRVPADTPQADIVEEAMAYSVTRFNEGQSLPARVKRWAQSVIALVRQALRKAGVRFQLSPADLQVIVKDSMKEPSNLASMDAQAAAFSKEERTEYQQAIDKGLDMSKEARMKRAKAMGYDFDNTLTHNGGDITAIEKQGLFDGIFASPGDESKHGFGSKETTFVTRRPHAGSGDIDFDYNKSIETLKKEYPDATNDEIDMLYEIAAEDSNIYDMELNPLERFGFDDLGEASWEGQRLRGRIAVDQGFDAVEMSDEHGTSYLIPSGSKARSINAAFDPDFKASSNILASKAPKFSKAQVEQTAFVRGGNVISGHPSLKKKNKLNLFLRRWFSSKGLLNTESFNAKIGMENDKNYGETIYVALSSDLKRAVKKAYGKSYFSLTSTQREKILDYLAGKPADVKEGIKPTLDLMRTALDDKSSQLQQTIIDLINYKLESLEGDTRERNLDYVNKALAGEDVSEIDQIDEFIKNKVNTFQTIEGNKGVYLNRSYEAFDNDNWESVVRKKADVMENARAYIEKSIKDREGLTGQALSDRVEGEISNILSGAANKKDMLSFLSSQQLGQKNNSILKQRKDVPVQIRELLGEYKDPVVNFSKSYAKMTYLVANHNFLKGVRDSGLGSFLSTKASGRMSEQIQAFDPSTMSPLQGLYSTPELKEEISRITEPETSGPLMRAVLQFNGAVKAGKVIVAPTTQARNFESAFFFAIMNGHFNMAKTIKAARAISADLRSKDNGLRDYMQHLVELGVLHDNPNAGELMDNLNDVSNLDNVDGGKLARGYRKTARTITNIYQASDDFWKVVGFENEMASLMKRKGMTKERAEKIAAERIRNGYPTYSLVPKAIRLLRKIPIIGTFTSFPWEIMRTTKNQFLIMAEDYQNGAKLAAARRAVGMSVAGAAMQVVASMLRDAFGVGDDDDEAIRNAGPEWQRNSTLLYTGVDDEGRLQYIDGSFVDPYAMLKKVVGALFNDNNETAKDRFVDSMTELLEPFLGFEIGTGTVAELIFNKRIHGGQVYNEEDPDWWKDAVSYAAKSLGPGIYGNIERSLKAFNGDVSRSGMEYTLADERLALIGIRSSTVNMPTTLRYKFGELSRRKSASSSILSYKLGGQNKISEDQIENAFHNMMTARESMFKDAHKMIKIGRKMGVSDPEIRDIMNTNGFSKRDIPIIMQYGIPRWNMSGRFLKSARDNARLTASKTRKAQVMADFNHRLKVVRKLANDQ